MIICIKWPHDTEYSIANLRPLLVSSQSPHTECQEDPAMLQPLSREVIVPVSLYERTRGNHVP